MKKYMSKIHIGGVIFSLFLVAISYFTKKLWPVMGQGHDWKDLSLIDFRIVDIVWILLWLALGILIFEGCLFAVEKLSVKKTETTLKKPVYYFLFSFILNTLSWGFQLIVFNPTCGFADTNIILSKYTRVKQQHPLFYISYVAGLFRVFLKRVEDVNHALMCVTLVQIILIALGIAWSIAYLAKKNINKSALWILICFFAFWPLVGRNSITLLKDPLYAMFVLDFSLCAYEIVVSKGQWLKKISNFIAFAASAYGSAFSRNNGLYVVIACAVFLIIFAYKTDKIRVFILLLTILIINKCIAPKTNNMVQEALAVPIQQVGMVAALDTERLQPQEFIDALEKTMPYERWGELYAIGVVDSIKWNPDFSGKKFSKNSSEFLKQWAKGIPRNFRAYVVAYLYQTYYLWSDNAVLMDNTSFQSYFYPMEWVDFSDVQIEVNGVQNENYITVHKNYLPEGIQNVIVIWNERFCKFFSAGICLLIVLLASFLFVERKEYAKLLYIMPGFLTWGTLMVSAPISMAFRYVDHYVLVIPVLFVFIFMREDTNNE